MMQGIREEKDSKTVLFAMSGKLFNQEWLYPTRSKVDRDQKNHFAQLANIVMATKPRYYKGEFLTQRTQVVYKNQTSYTTEKLCSLKIDISTRTKTIYSEKNLQ